MIEENIENKDKNESPIIEIENKENDDGTLAFLNIPNDPNSKQFNCPETTQQKLVNTSFYVIDFLEDMKTKFGDGRVLVKIKTNLSDSDSDAKKFFTNSESIKYILNEIRKRNAFPRKVTLRAFGNRYYFE